MEGCKHRCIDCGKPIHRQAKRCRSCAGKVHWQLGYHKNQVVRTPKFCLDCGNPIKWEAERCGSCAVKYAWKVGHIKPHLMPKGTASLRWKGKWDNAIYPCTYQPSHPRANKQGFVYDHILIWEEIHKRPLPKGWVVHHLNGIKNDNRPINLKGLPTRKHYLVLQEKAKRIQQLEALLNSQQQLL